VLNLSAAKTSQAVRYENPNSIIKTRTKTAYGCLDCDNKVHANRRRNCQFIKRKVYSRLPNSRKPNRIDLACLSSYSYRTRWKPMRIVYGLSLNRACETHLAKTLSIKPTMSGLLVVHSISTTSEMYSPPSERMPSSTNSMSQLCAASGMNNVTGTHSNARHEMELTDRIKAMTIDGPWTAYKQIKNTTGAFPISDTAFSSTYLYLPQFPN
jgi:hypothetical protein